MRKSSILGLSMATVAMLASGAAIAGPTTIVDGVTIPVGILPGGYFIDAELSFENVVTKVGQTFSGIFKVTEIDDAFANATYNYGQNSAYLTGVFTGFTATSVVAPTSSTAGQVTFSGGDIKYYVESTNTFTNNAGQATDLANASSGKLWLDLAAADSGGGTTLTITIPGGANSLTTFSGASAIALGNVAGGDAGPNFDTNTFAGGTDALFQGSAESGASGDFPISGTNHLKANIIAIPEPISISLFGAGLAGIAAYGARRRKNKKA